MKATASGRAALILGKLVRWACISFALVSAGVRADTVQGVDWLIAQAKPDGSVISSTRLATPFQATAEAVRALRESNAEGRPEVLAADQYIAAEGYHSTENLSREIIAGALAQQDVSALVAELAGSQGPDGGFGELAGYAATPLDTAFALESLTIAGGAPEAVQGALGYLLSSQKADGSWHAGLNEPSVYVTALVARAVGELAGVYSVETSLSAAQRFLLAQRDADGAWAEPYLSAAALLALAPHISDISLIGASAEALRATQSADGSWGDSVFATALALRALGTYAARESAAVGAGSGAVSGQVVRADNGAPIEGARVALTTGLSVETGADGRFLLAGVPTGTQTLQVTRQGYSGYSGVVSVADGAVAEMGQIVLAGVQTAAVVLGRAFEAESGASLSGVTVTLTGGAVRQASTGASGGFEFADVAAGDYELKFEKQGYYTVSLQLVLVGGQTASVGQALVKEGAWLDTSPGDLSGRVIDGDSGEPLAGARFTLDDGRSAETDSSGQFLLADVARGEHTAELTANGYSTQTYQFSFEAGMSGELGELALYPAPVHRAPTTLTVYGRVLDSVAGSPVPNATVTMPASGLTLQSGTDGRFTLNDLAATEFTLEISASGYLPSTYTVSASGYGAAAVDLPLSPASTEPAATSTRLEGHVTDATSGAPIAGASVSIAALGLSTTTDAVGDYVLADISELSFSLSMSAKGYQQRDYAVDVGNFGSYRIDGSMQALDTATPQKVQVLSLVPVVGRGGVDSRLLFDAQVANVSGAPLDVLFAGSVFNGGGEAVGEPVTFAPGSETPQAVFSFAADETKTVRVGWDTAQNAPDTYRLVLRAVEPGSITRAQPQGVVLADADAYGVVDAQGRFDGQLSFDPPLSQAGTSTPVEVSALILNSGNIPLPGGDYNVVVYDEAKANELYRATATLDTLPVANHALLQLGEWVPTAEGNLPVVVRAADASIVGAVEGTLYVGDKASGTFTVDRQIVPEGTQTVAARIAMQGVDTSQGSSTDPLFFAVREAVRKGGEFVASASLHWHERNRCLGCHIQTQSLVGLASSFDKAPIDKDAARFLFNAIASSQQADGGLRISHPGYTRTQTALGEWALTAWPDLAGAFPTKYRAAKHMYDRRSHSGGRTWWSPDHASGWWRTTDATTATVVKAYADLLRSAENIDLTTLKEFKLQNLGGLGAGSQPWDLEAAQEGTLYAVKASGAVTRYDPQQGTVETVATGLGINARGIAIGSAGEIYVAGTGGRVIRRNPDGSVEPLWTGSGTLMDIDMGPDGFLYVADYSNSRILRLSTQGTMEVLASGADFRYPTGLAFGGDGALYVANRGKYNILRVELGGAVSVFAPGLAYPPMWLAAADDGGFYLSTDSYYQVGQSTPRALNHVAADGTVERLHAASGIAGVATSAGRVFAVNYSGNSLYESVPQPLDTGMLDAYRLQLTDAAHYFLAGYRDGTSDNIRQAERLAGLAEIRSVVSDAGLVSDIDTAIDYLDNLLRGRQRADGGWGWYTWYGSDPMVTALVGLALEYTEPSADDPVIRSSIQYLLNQQGSDKAWRSYNRILSTKLAATSLVMAYMPKALERLGGIDVDLHLSLPSSVVLGNPSAQPDTVTSDGAGNTEYLWKLTGVTANTRNVDFDLTLQDMALGEVRSVASAAYMEFANSFTDERLRVALDVPAVRASSGLSLAVAADRDTYGADAPVAIDTTVVNTGAEASSATLELAIRAVGSGEPLTWLSPLAVDTLDPGASRSLGAGWNTGTTLAGDYEVYGRLVDGQGRVLDEDTDPFTIVHLAAPADSRVVTDKPVYEAWDQVQIAGRVRNAATNASLAPSIVEITVHSPAGQTLSFSSYAVGELQPQGYRDLPDALTLSDAAAGSYSVDLVVRDAFSHAVLSTSETAFVVQRHAMQALVGKVDVAPPRVYQGDPAVCTQTLSNRSETAVAGITVDRQLFRVDGQELVQQHTDSVSLAGQGNDVDVTTIDTGGLALGEYSCVLAATVEGRSAYLGAAGFEVVEPPIRIAAEMTSGPRGRLLVLLDDGTAGAPQGTDPLGPTGAPALGAQRGYLEGLLDKAGWSYTIVSTAADFARELNSGGYVVYALFAEHEKLSEQTQKALREAVYRGEGLLVGGRHDQRNGRLDPALGVAYRGKFADAQGIAVADSALHPAASSTFTMADKALRVDLAGAEPLGSFIGGSGAAEERTALTRYAYGEGKSVYVGYDVLAEATLAGADNLHGKLILSALAQVHPDHLDAFAGGVVPLRLTLTNEGIPTPGRVLLPLPSGTEIVDASGGALEPGAAVPTWVWPYVLDKDQGLTFDAWMRLPADGSAVSIEALLQTGSEPEFKDYETLSLFISPQARDGLDAAIATLAASSDKAFKPVLNDLQLAQRALDGGDYDTALGRLLKATDRLMDIAEPTAGSVRLMVDAAIWETALSI